MHIHHLPPWIPVATPEAKKVEKKPRKKFYHPEETEESQEAAATPRPPRPSDIFDEPPEEHTDILA